MTGESKILIVGLGVMGGSYAMALAKKGYTVFAVDKRAEAIAHGKSQGWLQQGIVLAPADYSLSAQNVRALQTMFSSVTRIVLGLYPEDILPWLRAYRTLFAPGTIVTDMAGVKGSFIEEAQSLMPSGCEFIASHPMAELEWVGAQYADDASFAKSNFLVVPTAANTETGINFATALGQALGFKRVTELTVADHDELISYVSALPHALAVCLMSCQPYEQLADVTGSTFRRFIHSAGINEELWSELMFANSANLSAQIGSYIDCLSELRRRLSNQDHEGLHELLTLSRQNRIEFERRRRS